MTIPSPFAHERLLFTPANPGPDPVPLIFGFPNEYSVGITSLGYQVVWAILASRGDLQVSRLFTDCHELLPRQPELVGFSLSWELDYTHLLSLLATLGIPRRSAQRNTTHPLIFGGGPVLTANPEPLADFLDVVLLGDGEQLLDAFISTYISVRWGDRSQKLRHLAQVPGVYVPSLYQVTYHGSEGPIRAIEPLDAQVPPTIAKQTYRGNTLSASTVVTAKAAWENIFMVEVVRSCPELCRFCLASYLTLPFRSASITDSLIPAIEQGITVTDRVGLLGASVTQHPEFGSLLDWLDQPTYDHIRLSIASVRTDTVTPKLVRILASHGTQSLTIAVESGSAHLRQIINKKLENEAIFRAAVTAKAGGLQGIKLYGMVGLPGEEAADLEATVALMTALKKAAPGLRLTLGCSTFVPKAHTPFQWFGVNPQGGKRLEWLQKRLRPQGIDFRPESYNWSVIQALISRGDRRLSHLLEQVWQYGGSAGSYRRAFKQLQGQLPTLNYYAHDPWSPEQPLPWQHIQGPLATTTLHQHLVQSGQAPGGYPPQGHEGVPAGVVENC